MRSMQPGQCFIAGFDGTEMTYELQTLIRDEQLGGVVLFERNVKSLDQLCALTTALRKEAQRPLIIAIDHEGGAVQHLSKPFTQLPRMRVVGDFVAQHPESTLAYDLGRAMGQELAAAGLNCNFAPVLDINTNLDNPIIGRRAFGITQAIVTQCGVAMIRGLSEGGVIACGKHFPGHGDTPVDSHRTLPSLPQTWDRLRWMELVPFQAAIEAGVPMLMTGHIVYGAIDASQPVTLSKRAITSLLREELAFEGVIVTDDLQMGAIIQSMPVEEAALRSLAAGCDCCLICTDLSATRRAITHVKKALDRGELSRASMEISAHRIGALATKQADLTPPARTVIGCEEHKSLISQL